MMKRLELTRFPQLDYATNESLNTLCTNLSFSGADIRRIMMTSCLASEGKSFLTMNMLRTFSTLGKKVVLVDADLRRSVISSRFGMRLMDKKNYGLTHYLAGMCEIEDVVYATNMEGAYIVPIGYEVSNSLSLLNTNRLTLLLDHLAEHFDFVLVDAPPVGLIIDAAEIAKSCDGTVLVVSYNRVSKRELIEAKRQVERSGCRVLGVVLNNVLLDSHATKRYYSRSYYSNASYDANTTTQKTKGKGKAVGDMVRR